MNALGRVNTLETGEQRFRVVGFDEALGETIVDFVWAENKSEARYRFQQEFPEARVQSLSLGAARKDTPILPWLVLGGVGAVIVWMLTRKQIGESIAAIAPLEPPSSFGNLGAVATRFDQVRELYRMGYLTPEKTLDELDVLAIAASDLEKKGKADTVSAQDLITRIAIFAGDVVEFMEPAMV